jgi:hypothetical protein
VWRVRCKQVRIRHHVFESIITEEQGSRLMRGRIYGCRFVILTLGVICEIATACLLDCSEQNSCQGRLTLSFLDVLSRSNDKSMTESEERKPMEVISSISSLNFSFLAFSISESSGRFSVLMACT